MSFVSYSEDIQKRHEADIHDLMRELELGQVSSAQQAHAIPHFEALVQSLKKILLDPESPAGIRLMDLRQQERRMAAENEILKRKNEKLAQTNTQLNSRALQSSSERERVRTELQTCRRECRALGQRISALEDEVASRDDQVAACKLQITKLESLAMNAQVDRRI
jgi:hypothetical protein